MGRAGRAEGFEDSQDDVELGFALAFVFVGGAGVEVDDAELPSLAGGVDDAGLEQGLAQGGLEGGVVKKGERGGRWKLLKC